MIHSRAGAEAESELLVLASFVLYRSPEPFDGYVLRLYHLPTISPPSLPALTSCLPVLI